MLEITQNIDEDQTKVKNSGLAWLCYAISGFWEIQGSVKSSLSKKTSQNLTKEETCRNLVTGRKHAAIS